MAQTEHLPIYQGAYDLAEWGTLRTRVQAGANHALQRTRPRWRFCVKLNGCGWGPCR
jgi:hypothetical protein